MAGDTSGHRWSYAERLVDTGEIVVHEVDRDGRDVFQTEILPRFIALGIWSLALNPISTL